MKTFRYIFGLMVLLALMLSNPFLSYSAPQDSVRRVLPKESKLSFLRTLILKMVKSTLANGRFVQKDRPIGLDFYPNHTTKPISTMGH